MIDWIESERHMLAREAGYINELKETCGPELSAEVLAVMSGLYRAGWRDCLEMQAVNSWNDRIDQLVAASEGTVTSSEKSD